MSTYEEFMVIINVAMLIVAILVYLDKHNGRKNSRPPASLVTIF